MIVAVRKNPDSTTEPDISGQDRQLARFYNERGAGNSSSAPDFEQILSLEQEEGFIRVIVQFKKMHPVHSQYPHATATIERVIPIDQVTLEIVRASDFPPLPERRRF
ncbi:MAG: hypothetical protein F4204_02355 [Rhodospirillaceae bacterium]|nr:hypothetical protein [Rhodospirillaceae bacterium]MYB15270.1 hypothetical protein [Rhodospirillaceae bacterium]MYG51208.1 hypothetical protein [Rhodospirillaceae bacterium]MYI50719.1 hypothetical protein [Rhodospirillaceae bacterium]